MFQNFKTRVHNVIDNATGKVIATVGGLAAYSGSALAAVPVDVTTALTDAKADALTVAGLALIIIIAVAAFKYMRGAVK